VRTFALLVAVLLLLAGSSPSQGGELSAVELKDARQLYVGKCAKCHKLPDPAKYTPEKWDGWMTKMTAKSKLKPDQVELLNRYVKAGRAGEVKLPT
jgi:hypothetical protein